MDWSIPLIYLFSDSSASLSPAALGGWIVVSIYYLGQGLIFGSQAAFAPGPLTTLVISESLSHGPRAGIKCSFAPLVSDPPVILLSLLVLNKISGVDAILGSVSLIGAILLAWIAYKSFQVRAEQFENPSNVALPFYKVVVFNFMNPNVYVYWMTVLGPLCLTAIKKYSFGYALLFMITFYSVMLIGKVTLSVIAGGARHRLNTKWLVAVNHLLGLAMLIFVIQFAYFGMKQLAGW